MKLDSDSFACLDISYSDIHDGRIFLFQSCHHDSFSFSFGLLVFGLDFLSFLDLSFNDNVTVLNFKFCQGISRIDRNSIMYFQRFWERVFVKLDWFDFCKFIFYDNLVLVRYDGKETLFVVLHEKIAKTSQTLIIQWVLTTF